MLLPQMLVVAMLGSSNEPVDPLKALEHWHSSVEGIWSYDVTVHVTVRSFLKGPNTLVPVGDYILRQRFMQGSWRVDQLHTKRFYSDREAEEWKASETEINAFAYEYGTGKVRYFNSASNFGELGSVVGFHHGKLLSPQHYEAFRGDFYGQTFKRMLEPRIEQATVAAADHGLIELSFAPAPDPAPPVTHATASIQVVLDPERGYMPTKITRRPNPGGNLEIETVNELTSVAAGLWAPLKTTTTTRSPMDTGNTEVPMSIIVLEIDSGRSLYNVDLSPLTFQLPFPPGTVVRDRGQRLNYVEAGGDSRDYAAYDELIQARTLASGDAPSARRGSLPVWALVASALAFAAAALVLRRYCPRRSAPRNERGANL